MQLKIFFQYWFPPIVLMLLLAYLSFLTPVSRASPQIQLSLKMPLLDLGEHFFAYGLLAFLLYRLLQSRLSHKEHHATALLTILLAIGYGLLLELNQMFLPGRAFSLSDIGANTLGSIISIYMKPAASRTLKNIVKKVRSV